MANYKPKTCKQCGSEFTPNHSRTLYCSPECVKAKDRSYYKAWIKSHPDRKCEYDKKYAEKNKEKIARRARKWREANADHLRESKRKYYEENKEAILEKGAIRNREWREKNRQRALERQRQWRKKNPERAHALYREWYENNKERQKETCRRWRATNPDKVGKARATRAQAELEGNATTELIEAKWEAGDKACILCGQPIDDTLPARHPKGRTLEHLTPIHRGGPHNLDNIDFAHRSCNASKGTKTLEEYRAWQARLQQAS